MTVPRGGSVNSPALTLHSQRLIPLRDDGFLACGVGDGVAFTAVDVRSNRMSVRTGRTVVVDVVVASADAVVGISS